MKKIRKTLFLMLLSIFCVGFGVKALAAETTWNPNDKASSCILSNNNMTASISNIHGVRATNFKTSGKWYWEITVNQNDTASLGVANDNPKNISIPSSSPDLSAYYGYSGRYIPGDTPYGQTFKANDVIGIALDIDAKKINFYKNNIHQGEKSIPDMGKYYPFYANLSSYITSTVTANFGATQFKYAPPTGFIPFDSISPSTISLDIYDLHLIVGESNTINATVLPNDTTNKVITWSSSDSTIVTVDSTGKVTAIKEGQAVITATVEGTNLTATCNVTVNPISKDETITVESLQSKLRVGQEFTTDIVLHNGINICAEDIKIDYNKDLFEYVGYDVINGLRVVKELKDSNTGALRFIIASLGKDNAINGDKTILKLKFKAKAVGTGKVDVIKARIADNGTIEKDILTENCGEKEFTVTTSDVNRNGEFTLLDLGIDAWYYGANAEDTDTSKYDTDVVINGKIDDGDLLEIVEQMLKNPNYQPNN